MLAHVAEPINELAECASAQQDHRGEQKDQTRACDRQGERSAAEQGIEQRISQSEGPHDDQRYG